MIQHFSYRKDIDGLRAIAVLAVIIFHYFPKVIRGGFLGVDVFFVISGFLISGIIFKSLDKNQFTFTDFYVRRIRRILPALIVVLLSCLAIGWFMLLPEEFKMLGKHVAASTLFATNIELYLENGYFDSASNSKPLLHLWSLGVEEQYYLLWPVIVLLVYRFKANLFLTILFLSTASILFAATTQETFSFFMPHTRFWELSFGSLLAYLELRKISLFPKFKNAKSIIGFSALAAIMCHGKFSVAGAFVAVLASFLIISAGKDAWINRKILSNKFLVSVGLISYPLYLWHWPLLVLLKLHKEKISRLDAVLALVASFILAWLTYKFIEAKIRHRKEKSVPIILLAIFVVLGFVGFAIYKKDGVISRFPQAMAPIFQMKSNSQAMRYETCFLSDKGQSSDEFKNCIEEGKATLVFLWGDSHSAHLYPGLAKLQKPDSTFRLAQFNVGSCPPILGNKFEYLGNKFCQKNNDFIFQKIVATRPEIVILSFSLSALPQADLRQIEATIKLLKKEKLKVVLVGTMPLYNAYRHDGNFTKFLVKLFQEHNALPKRNKVGLSDLSEEEKILKKIAQDNKINYLSLLDLLCNEEGCILEVGGELITHDGGHLTAAGSDFAAREIVKYLKFGGD